MSSVVSRIGGSDEQKPKKPHPDFPLFPHATKRWAKKVRGKFHYFGPWRDPDGALAEWLRVKDDLLAGREPRAYRDGLTVEDICNEFLFHRKGKVDSGEMRQRTWDEYQATCTRMCEVWGRERYADDIRPIDFQPLRVALAKGRRPKTLHNEIGRCLAVINFANKNELTDRPIQMGTYFNRPSAKTLRQDRAAQDHMGEMMLEAEQIRAVLDVASVQVKAMILLAINVGIGNEDCGRLEFRHLDLKTGWLDYPRPKTSVRRRAKLWKETVAAIDAVISERKQPASRLEKYVFVTKYGQTWHKPGSSNPISHEFRKFLKQTGNYTKGVGFYSLRRTFETIASETNDQPAIDLSMGHESPDMASLYRQRLGDERLVRVSYHVRRWLFRKKKSGRT